MRRGHAILLLGLLFWIDPASAQKLKIYPLTVSIHQDVHPGLTQEKIEKILKDASALLQQSSNSCGVGFKFKGFVPFTSRYSVINDPVSLEDVHRVPADVKVVQKINYCAHGRDTGLVGCSWRPDNKLPRTMIVTTDPMLGANAEHVLWAHEFGHVTGLLHRSDDRDALMWWCGLGVINRFINKDECHHFIAGRPKKYLPGVGPACPPGQ